MFVRALGVRVAVRSDAGLVLRDLRRLLAGFEVGLEPHGSSADVTLRVTARVGTFRLLCEGRSVLETGCYPYLIASLEHLLAGQLTARASGVCLFHAGAVARGRRAVLLPGNHGAGKTTLVARLVQRGLAYCCDEMAPVSLSSLDLLPLPRPMRIKGQTARLLSPLGRTLRIAPYGGHPDEYPGRWALPVASRLARSPVGLAAICFLRRSPGTRARLIELRRSQTVLELASMAYGFTRLGARGLDLLVALAARASCSVLEYDDLDLAGQAVEGLLASAAGSRAAGAGGWPAR